LSKIDRVENRIRQIEQRIERGPQINSAAFNKLMAGHAESKQSTSLASPDAAMNKLNNMGHFNLSSIQGLNKSTTVPGAGASVTPLAQSNSVSCGQTSVAMCLNSITGANLNDMNIDQHYGFQLLKALKTESRSAGFDWQDRGNITNDSWSFIDKKVNQEGLPVIVALNGPEFSPSGRGHIVTITKTTADTVTYADPADGKIKTTNKSNMVNAPSHPDGNFLFVADRVAPDPMPTEPFAANDFMNNPSDGML
jgi:peptidase C39-like protein